MCLNVQGFSVSKSGSLPEECEDAFDYDLSQKRAAIADGVTLLSFRSKQWALRLVERFVAASPLVTSSDSDLLKWLEPIQSEWSASIRKEWQNLPWYQRNKARYGSRATLLGIEFFFSNNLREPTEWQALAIGDCCLFHVRNDTLCATFPFKSSDEFNNFPSVVSSDRLVSASILTSAKIIRGEYKREDIFCLATDELAKWLLSQHEAGKKPWALLREIRDQDQFSSFINQIREASEVINDDMTLLLISCRPFCRRPTEKDPGRADGRKSVAEKGDFARTRGLSRSRSLLQRVREFLWGGR